MKKIELHEVEKNQCGIFFPGKKFRKRIKNNEQHSEEIIEAGVSLVFNACYNDKFLVFLEREVIYDLNNYSILRKAYGENYWDKDKPFLRGVGMNKGGFYDNKKKYVLIGGMKNIWHWLNNFLPRVFLVKEQLENNFNIIYYIYVNNHNIVKFLASQFKFSVC